MGPLIGIKIERSYLTTSFLIHLFLVVSFYITVKLGQRNYITEEKIEFRVIEKPIVSEKETVSPLKSRPIRIKPVKKKKIKKRRIKPRKVYGISRKTIKVKDRSAPVVKAGNTIAKKGDKKVLKKSDEQSLPIPQEEYLVTSMPKIIEEFRVPYPEGAKMANVEGKVILEILIDQNGKVRKATLISGPGKGLNRAALEAIYKFKFRPAKIGNQKVAVLIRYGINFVLER